MLTVRRPPRAVRSFVVALMAICVVVAAPALPAGAAGTGSVSGTVFRTGGGSVEGLTVKLYSSASYPDPVATTTTSAGGGYSFSNLDFTLYQVQLVPPSDAPLTVQATLTTFSLSAGAPSVTEANFVLTSTSGFRGNLTIPGSSTERIVSIAVQNAATGDYVSYSSAVVSGAATTPYQVTGLTPGSYRVLFSGNGLRSEYYNNVTEFESATTIVVPNGVWGANVDASLEIQPPLIRPVAATRLFDTRVGRAQGAVAVTKTPVGPSRTLTIQVAGAAAVPASGVAAVSLTVTAANPSDGGYVTVYPCGTRPTASSLNFAKGAAIANTVIAPLSGSGTVCFYASANTDLIADISGYSRSADGFESLAPQRYLDTRAGKPQGLASVTKTKVGPGATKAVPATGLGGVPAGAKALSVNVTATGSTSGGYVSVFPCSDPSVSSGTSTLNFGRGQTIANAAIVGAADKLCVSSNVAVDVIIDVNGYVTASGGLDTSLSGIRLYDTRPGKSSFFGVPGKIGGQKVLSSTVSPYGAVVALNIAITNTTTAGFVTVWDCAEPRPTTSNINYVAGQTIANLVIAPSAANGSMCVYASSLVDVIIDLVAIVPQA